MKEKININTNLIRALKERVKRSQALVETVRKNYNEFLGYWLVCYDAASFNALDLFEPDLFDASLKFNPGDFYNKYYERTGRDYNCIMSLLVSLISQKNLVMVLCCWILFVMKLMLSVLCLYLLLV